jgi:tetratricopeptide (TPR) repeat protein
MLAIRLTLLLISTSSVAAVDAASTAESEAQQAFDAKDWPTAVTRYEALSKADPKNIPAFLRWATALHNAGRYEDALAVLQKAPPAAPKIHVAMRSVRAYAKLNQPDRAISSLEQAVQGGFAAVPLLKTDPELEPVRAHPKFAAILDAADRNARPCAFRAESKQFDFWLGEWDVTVSGSAAGSSRVEKILNDCVLLENWESAGGGSGKSFNLYDTENKQWRQTWVSANGEAHDYVGKLDAKGAIVFVAKVKTVSGKKGLRRMTFTQLSPHQVRQYIEDSDDHGRKWVPSFDGLYTRKQGSSGGATH